MNDVKSHHNADKKDASSHEPERERILDREELTPRREQIPSMRYSKHGHYYEDDLKWESRIRSQTYPDESITGVTNNTRQQSEASRRNDQYYLEETADTSSKMDSGLRSVHRRWTHTTGEKDQNNHKGDWFDSNHHGDIHTRPQSSMNDVGRHDQNMEPILPIWPRHRKSSVYNAELSRKTSFTVQRHSMQMLPLADDDYVWKIPNPRRKSSRERDQKRSLDPTLVETPRAANTEIQTPSMHGITRKKESRHSQKKTMENLNTNPRVETCEELEYHLRNQSSNDHHCHRKSSVYNAELPRKTSFTVQRHSMEMLPLAEDDYVWKIPNPRRQSSRRRDQKRSPDPTLVEIPREANSEIQTPSMHSVTRKKESRHSQKKTMENINTNPRVETCEELEYRPKNQSPNDHSLMFTEGRDRSRSFPIWFQENFNPQSCPDSTETLRSHPMPRKKTSRNDHQRQSNLTASACNYTCFDDQETTMLTSNETSWPEPGKQLSAGKNQSPNDHSLMFNEGRDRSRSFPIGFQENFNPQSCPDSTETLRSHPMPRKKTSRNDHQRQSNSTASASNYTFSENQEAAKLTSNKEPQLTAYNYTTSNETSWPDGTETFSSHAMPRKTTSQNNDHQRQPHLTASVYNYTFSEDQEAAKLTSNKKPQLTAYNYTTSNETSWPGPDGTETFSSHAMPRKTTSQNNDHQRQSNLTASVCNYTFSEDQDAAKLTSNKTPQLTAYNYTASNEKSWPDGTETFSSHAMPRKKTSRNDHQRQSNSTASACNYTFSENQEAAKLTSNEEPWPDGTEPFSSHATPRKKTSRDVRRQSKVTACNYTCFEDQETTMLTPNEKSCKDSHCNPIKQVYPNMLCSSATNDARIPKEEKRSCSRRCSSFSTEVSDEFSNATGQQLEQTNNTYDSNTTPRKDAMEASGTYVIPRKKPSRQIQERNSKPWNSTVCNDSENINITSSEDAYGEYQCYAECKEGTKCGIQCNCAALAPDIHSSEEINHREECGTDKRGQRGLQTEQERKPKKSSYHPKKTIPWRDGLESRFEVHSECAANLEEIRQHLKNRRNAVCNELEKTMNLVKLNGARMSLHDFRQDLCNLVDGGVFTNISNKE